MKKLISLTIVILILFSTFSTAYADDYPEAYRKGTEGFVCLTFDDGYGRDNINKIIETLHEKDVNCTFFVIGTQLKAFPDLWQKALSYGDEIAYHSMYHTLMGRKSSDFILNDINQWNSTAQEALGDCYLPSMILRLPGGSGYNSPRIMDLIADTGYTAVSWNLDTMTGVTAKSKHNTSQRIRKYILSKATVDSIILMHFDKFNADALPYYIDDLKAKFRLGTISEELDIMPHPDITATPVRRPVDPVKSPEPVLSPHPILTSDSALSSGPSMSPEPSPSPQREPSPEPASSETSNDLT